MSKTLSYINILVKHPFLTINCRSSQCVLFQKRCYSTKDSNNDEDKNTKDLGDSALENRHKTREKSDILSKETTKENAKKKLLSLLSELKVDPESARKEGSNLNLAKAVKRPPKAERFKEVLEKSQRTPEDEIEMAAKKVAETVRGDPQKTLSQLNEKLRILNLAKQPPVAVEEMNEDNLNLPEDIGKTLLETKSNQKIMSSVEEVAAAVTDSSFDKSLLSHRLQRLSLESESTSTPKKSLDDLVKTMAVDKKSVQGKVQNEKPKSLQRNLTPRKVLETQFNLFQAPPLNLPINEETKVDAKESVWKHLEEKRLKLMVQFAPANAFEEMIMWTEQGKHWKFPIDNETEMGSEENVGFHEHVFLEEHLHGFPTKGPIRHFMELVVVGLSTNPYISVERKIENIDWFRNYFKDKEELLQELGALG